MDFLDAEFGANASSGFYRGEENQERGEPDCRLSSDGLILYRIVPWRPKETRWRIPALVGGDRTREPDRVSVQSYIDVSANAAQRGDVNCAIQAYILLCRLFASYSSGYDPSYFRIEHVRMTAASEDSVVRFDRGEYLANAIFSIEMLAMYPRIFVPLETLEAISNAGYESLACALSLGLDVHADLYKRSVRASLVCFERLARKYVAFNYPDTGLDLIKTLAFFLVSLASPTLDHSEIASIVKETEARNLFVYYSGIAEADQVAEVKKHM